MKNLIQIICGAGGAETIEECVRVPESLGATIIVVYALWPQYDYPNGDPNFAKTSDFETLNRVASSLAIASLRNNFSLSQTGIDFKNDLNPNGASARYVSRSLSNFTNGFS